MITFALAAICCLGAQAQEKLFNSASVQSPVVNKDGTVLAMASMMPQAWPSL